MPTPIRRLARTDAVDQVRYLAANIVTARYRVIMRHFYDQHQLHHYTQTADQILATVHELWPDYSTDDLQNDLTTLVKWGNLEPDWTQGLSGVRTIEDFRRRNVVYSATPDALAIERLMVELERRGEQVGELDGMAMTTLQRFLTEFTAALDLPPEASNRLERLQVSWRSLWLHFALTAEGANSYMQNMRRQEQERLFDLEAFQLYKQALIDYLTDFVDGLIAARDQFAAQVGHWDTYAIAGLLAEAMLASSQRFEDPAHLRVEYGRQVGSLVAWFGPGGSAETLRSYSLHAIERVSRAARRLSDSRRGLQSRLQDLLMLAERFHGLTDPAQAEQLSAALFGYAHPLHWQLEVPEQVAEDATVSSWAVSPLETPIRERRNYGQRKPATGQNPADVAMEKERLRALDRERQAEAARLIKRLFADGRFDLSQAGELLPSDRDQIFSWVFECLANGPAFSTHAADGSSLRLLSTEPDRLIWLAASDGRLLTGDYTLVREEG